MKRKSDMFGLPEGYQERRLGEREGKKLSKESVRLYSYFQKREQRLEEEEQGLTMMSVCFPVFLKLAVRPS